jgi:uncharacterized membrane protein YeaQ/YmgE (transglycosylase-associated protein family)
MLSLIIWYIVAGLIVGALARLVVPGRNPMGIVLTVVIGIVGSIVGGLVSYALGLHWLLTLIVSVAVAALLVYFFTGSRRRRAVL